MLKEKWWKQRKGGGKCKEVPDSGAAALGLSNVGGVFVVLIGGLGMACIIGFAEYMWNRREQKRIARMQASISQSNCTETTTGTLTRTGMGPGSLNHAMGSLGPFENGHVTHLDLAAVHDRGGPYPPYPNDNGGGGFLSASLSAAALNNTSCAVPMMGHEGMGGLGPQQTPRGPHHHPLSHSSSLGWASNSNTLCGRGNLRYASQHQEQCPHFNDYKYKEAPT